MAVGNITLEEMKEHRAWFFALGVLLLIFGFLMIIFPVAGTFTIELLFGILLLLGGLVQLALAFRTRGWGGFLYVLLIGILYVVAGLLLLGFPVSGVLTLTLLLGAFLLVEGILKMAMAFRLKPEFEWEWLLFGGIIAVLLGVLILINWPSDALWVIGLLFGIDMFLTGLSSVIISLALGEVK